MVILRIPLTEIRVSYRTSTRRPITELDRLVMKAISEGAYSVGELRRIFQLRERLLVECLVDLMEMALLAVSYDGDGFRLTEFGTRSLEKKLTAFGERLDEAEQATFLRENLTGSIAPGQVVWFRRLDDVLKADIKGLIPHGEIERLLVQELKNNKEGRHLHSIESVVPFRDGVSFEVKIEGGKVYDLPSRWQHLQPLLMVEAEKRSGISLAASVAIDNEGVEDSPLWAEVSIDATRDVLLTVRDHENAFREAIKEAHSHLLVLSAHVSEPMLRTLEEPVREAIQRGVRVDVISGLPSLEPGGALHATMVREWQRRIRSGVQGSGDRLSINDDSVDSDAKVLIWDVPDGSYRAIVGSYNWLYGSEPSFIEKLGSEVGIRLSDPRLIGTICTTLSGWLDACGQRQNGIALRWSNIGRKLAQKDPPPLEGNGALIRATVIYDEDHARYLSEALRTAKNRVLVTSHKLNRIATGSQASGGGRLAWLARRMEVPEFQFVLVAGKKPKPDSWETEDQTRLKALVDSVKGSLCIGTGEHARLLIYDDQAIVTSYNFLSTTHDKRQIGIRLRGEAIADKLWAVFKQSD